ncbi:MAG: F0F1 ATP synthase subunit B [bacterium]|nr:F0F1 ATP synthase subunit B [bacterium]
MDEFISTFHIDWKLMLAQTLNFGLVFLALYLLAAKPLKKLIQERTDEITTGLMDAKTNKETLKATKEEYDKVIRQAKSEAQALFESSKKEATDKKNEMLEMAKTEVAVIIENGKKILEADKAKMISDARNEVASLVIQATEKVLQEKSK